jgi:hypothetical protein
MANLLRPVGLLLGDAIRYNMDLTEAQISRGKSCLDRVGHQIEALALDALSREDQAIVEAATTSIALLRQLYDKQVRIDHPNVRGQHETNVRLLGERQVEQIIPEEPRVVEVDCWASLVQLVNRVAAYVKGVWASIVNYCSESPPIRHVIPQAPQPHEPPPPAAVAHVEPLIERTPFRHPNARFEIWNMTFIELRDQLIAVSTALHFMRRQACNRERITNEEVQVNVASRGNLKINELAMFWPAYVIENLPSFGFESGPVSNFSIPVSVEGDDLVKRNHLRDQIQHILDRVLENRQNIDQEGFATLILSTQRTISGILCDPISERYYVVTLSLRGGEPTLVQVVQSLKDAASILSYNIGEGAVEVRSLKPVEIRPRRRIEERGSVFGEENSI